MLHGANHLQAYIGRLYLKRTVRGRRLILVEDCVKMKQFNLLIYIDSKIRNWWKLEKKEHVLKRWISEVDLKCIQEQHKVAKEKKALHFEKATEINRGKVT